MAAGEAKTYLTWHSGGDRDILPQLHMTEQLSEDDAPGPENVFGEITIKSTDKYLILTLGEDLLPERKYFITDAPMETLRAEYLRDGEEMSEIEADAAEDGRELRLLPGNLQDICHLEYYDNISYRIIKATTRAYDHGVEMDDLDGVLYIIDLNELQHLN